MISFKGKSIPVREKRLNTLSAYLGSTVSLLQEIRSREDVKQRIRTFSETHADDVILALKFFSGLRNVGIVVHGPRGCAAASLYFASVRQPENGNHWMVSNLEERDTIMGGEEKLREAILALHKRYRPPLILVVTTPVVAINNDDVFAVIAELSDELDTKILPVYVDGFTSQAAIGGYDAAAYALLKQLPFEREVVKEKGVAVLSVNENAAALTEIKRLLAALGIPCQVLPQGSGLQDLPAAAGAAVSIALNRDETDVFGRVLQEVYQVDFLSVPPPIGIAGTYQWLAALGWALGLQAEVEALHAAEAEKLNNIVQNSSLRGKTVYVSLPAAIAWRTVNLVQELGGQVAGLTVDHVDELHEQELAELAARQPELPIHVGPGQIFEQMNLLRQTKPDLYIGLAEDVLWAAKAGIVAVALEQTAIFGYRGVAELNRQSRKAFANQAFIRQLQTVPELAYKETWYQKKANWHIKLEVK